GAEVRMVQNDHQGRDRPQGVDRAQAPPAAHRCLSFLCCRALLHSRSHRSGEMVRRAPAVVLPTGPKVWRRYYRPVKGLFRALLRARRTVRRRWFLLRVRAVAAVNGAEIALDVAREVELGRGVRVQVQPGTRNSMTIGPK